MWTTSHHNSTAPTGGTHPENQHREGPKEAAEPSQLNRATPANTGANIVLAITHKPAFLIGKREWIVVYPDMEPMLNMCSNPDHQHVVPPSEKPWFFLTMSGAEDAGNGLVAIKVIKFENIDGETIGDSNLLYTGNGTKIIAPSDKTFMVLLTGFTTFGGMN